MTDYKKLVKALRLCQFGECGCGKCYYKKLKGDWCTEDNHPEFFDCDDKLKLDSAAAIEALNRLVDLNTQRCEELRKQLREAHESYERHLNELEAQLPKRGEWITIRLNNGGSYTGCSCCEAPIPTDTMLDYIPESESKYCYSCGARMEVQDG